VNATVMPSLFPLSAGRVRISASTATAITALNGIRFALTLLQSFQPGTAPSRENAYIMREELVMQLMPQNSWPMTAMMRIAFTHPVDIAARNTAGEPPPPSVTAFGSAAAKVIASSTM
jgi:hypothetical protein